MSIRVDLEAEDIAFARHILQLKIEEALQKARLCYQANDHYMHDTYVRQQAKLMLLKAKFDGTTDPEYLAYLKGTGPEPRD
jgi:citrate lyase beta subunit